MRWLVYAGSPPCVPRWRRRAEYAFRPSSFSVFLLAVRIGDLQAFTKALSTHQKQFLSDGTYTLILRLRHTVIKTALRQLSLSYSKIPLQEITRKLHLDSEEEAEYIVAKSIRDNVIEASLEHEKGFMKSKDFSLNIYNTNEPQKMFDQRIGFCLQLHNESVKVGGYRAPLCLHAARGFEKSVTDFHRCVFQPIPFACRPCASR